MAISAGDPPAGGENLLAEQVPLRRETTRTGVDGCPKSPKKVASGTRARERRRTCGGNMLHTSPDIDTACRDITPWAQHEEKIALHVANMCERSFVARRPPTSEIHDFCDWWMENGGELDILLDVVHQTTSSLVRRTMVGTSRADAHDRAARAMADIVLADDIAATFHEGCARDRQQVVQNAQRGSHRNAVHRTAFSLPSVQRVDFCAISIDGPELDRARIPSLVELMVDSAAAVDLSSGRPRILATLADNTSSVATCEQVRTALGPATRISVEPITPKGWFRPFRDADRVMNLATALNIEPGVHRAADFPIEFAAAHTTVVREHLVAVLAPVMTKDNLRTTLLSLVHFKGNRTRAAEALAIHRSTIDYRLDCIKQITGYSPLTLAGLNMLSIALAVHTLTA
ncbi:CdaR family transcriptional regulator [Lentzea sp. HUAS12]|uniref:PucR family transcriptional regulator n=1 Tax=Lentzea sp. HUAS12 TaxID=2951806 RepID=UPI00209DDFB7|nr:PucR family transcriptional regulator [Lentzea sp. HUAS12]USX56258.1 helix-turn-helix domain-containing protein [Lentzea sp. HUAS12]